MHFQPFLRLLVPWRLTASHDLHLEAYSQYLPSRVIVYFLIQLYFADALQSNWIQVALVYNRLGYHWATTTTASTSLLALLTLVMLLCFLLYQFSRHRASNI